MVEERLKIIIVDDELPIRQGLSRIDWSKFGTELVGEAANGYEALDLCRKLSPDIVITDIVMPRMDGLELFRRLKEEFPNIQVILLTCYSDFDYSVEALKLGAVDYVVKVAMDEKHLEKAINRARELIYRNMCYDKKLRRVRRYELSKILMKQFGSERLTADEFMESLRHNNLNITFPCRIISLYCNARNDDHIFVDEEISLQLEEIERDFGWIPFGTGVYYLVFPWSSNELDIIKSKVEKILSVLNMKIRENLYYIIGEIQMFAYISNVLNCPEEYARQFCQVASYKELCFYCGDKDDNTVLYGDIEPLQALNDRILSQVSKDAINAVQSWDHFVEFVKENFYKWAHRNRIKPMDLKAYLLKLLVLIENKNQNLHMGIKEVHKAIWQSQSLDEMVDSVVYLPELLQAKDKNYRYEVQHAMEYISKHIEEPISLSLIADKVKMSPRYLSRLFKEELGQSYSEYVTRIRMEKAAELLQTTNLKIYEVAERVGIPNYRYFCNVFRNWAGITPKEYRKGV